MSTTTFFNTQIIGQTEKALGALMNQVLTRTAGTFPQWVALKLTAGSGGAVDRNQLAARMAGALKIENSTAQAAITQLTDAQMLRVSPGTAPHVSLTDAGQARYHQIQEAVDEITTKLYGDLPADDLAAAGRVLSTVMTRANAELAHV